MSALARAKAKRDRALAASENHGKAADLPSSESQGDHSIIDPYSVFSSSARPANITRPKSSLNSNSSYSPYQPILEEEDDRYLDPGIFETHGAPGYLENICESEAGVEQEDEIDYVKQSEAAFLGNSRGHSSCGVEGDEYHDRKVFFAGRHGHRNEGEYLMSSGGLSSDFDFKASQTVSPTLHPEKTEAPDSSLEIENFLSSKKNAARGAAHVTGSVSGGRTTASRMISGAQPRHRSKASEITTAVTPPSSIPIESTHRTPSKRSDEYASTIIKSESEAPGVPRYRLTRANKRRKPTDLAAPALSIEDSVIKGEEEDLKAAVGLASKFEGMGAIEFGI